MAVKPLSGKLRIIGGRWRSRQLPVLDLPGLRPTTDRIRETVFNWLQADIAGATCLDLFAGSGALGFEAASRGAQQVLMLELQPEAYKKLCDNKRDLEASNIVCERQDAMQWLNKHCSDDGLFDVVFLDPPYDSGLLAKACLLLEQSGRLSDMAKIYLEHPVEQSLPELPENWQINRGKKAGQVMYYLLQRQSAEQLQVE